MTRKCIVGGSATGGDIGRGEEAGGSTCSEGDTISPASSPRLTTRTNATNLKGEEAANEASPADQGVSAASSPLRPRGTQAGVAGGDHPDLQSGIYPADQPHDGRAWQPRLATRLL